MEHSNFEYKKMSVTCLGPVHITDEVGTVYSYQCLYDAGSRRGYFLNERLWVKFLYKHDLLAEFEELIKTRLRAGTLCEWVQEKGFKIEDLGDAVTDYAGVEVAPEILAANKMRLTEIVRTVHNVEGQPYIPGSSIKGALRTGLLFSLPLWKLPQDAMGGEPFTPQHRSFPELLKITGVPEVLVCFLCYCALESTAGMWASSYCTLVRGLDAQTAASWASLFYLGITAGRFVSGFLTMKMSDRNMIRLGQVLIALGILLVLLPAGNNVLFVGLILIGLGCAPVYPCIIHETPVNFGRELSMSMTGLQMAFAYVGSCLAPPLFGLLAQNVTPRLYPWYLAVGLVVMVIMSESLHAKKAAKHR